MARRVIRSCFSAIVLPVFFFAASAAADEKLVCSDAYSQAQTLRDEHKLLSARQQLRVCARSECPAFMIKECADWLLQVEGSIPTVVIDAKDGAGNDLSAVKVTMDGRVLAERLTGASIAIDPGEHAFVFEAAGQPPVSRTLLLREGERERHLQVVIGPAAPEPPPPPVRAPTPAAPADADSKPRSGSSQRTMGLIAGGVGVAGLALGGALGLLASSRYHDAKNTNCPTGACNAQGKADTDGARSTANVGTAFFVVGAVGLVGGAVLWFTAPGASAKSNGVSPEVGIGAGMLTMRGKF